MFENVINFLKNIGKKEQNQQVKSKDAAKERLQLVLMQDRANISADFLDLMKQEIIEVIKKYIDVDENAIDVRLTNKANEDGTNGAPSLYANIPIISIKEEVKVGMARQKDVEKEETKIEEEKNDKEIEEISKEDKISEEKEEQNVEETQKQEEVVEVQEQENENQELEQQEKVEDENKEEIKNEN